MNTNHSHITTLRLYASVFILLLLPCVMFTGIFAQETTNPDKAAVIAAEQRAQLARMLSPTATFATSSTLPVSIPDNNATFTCINFPVSGLTTNVSQVSLSMGLTHTWTGDLRAELRAPGGSPAHVLFYDIGDTASPAGAGDSSNLSGVYNFADSAATTLWTGALGGGTSFNIPAGDYRTTNINANTATSLNTTFAGLTPAQANGTWQFCISDNQGADTGTINTSANLTVTPAAPTGATVTLEGHVQNELGFGVRNAIVTLTDLLGNERATTVKRRGFYKFEDVAAGADYILTVQAKGFAFSPESMFITPFTNTTDLNFMIVR